MHAAPEHVLEQFAAAHTRGPSDPPYDLLTAHAAATARTAQRPPEPPLAVRSDPFGLHISTPEGQSEDEEEGVESPGVALRAAVRAVRSDWVGEFGPQHTREAWRRGPRAADAQAAAEDALIRRQEEDARRRREREGRENGGARRRPDASCLSAASADGDDVTVEEEEEEELPFALGPGLYAEQSAGSAASTPNALLFAAAGLRSGSTAAGGAAAEALGGYPHSSADATADAASAAVSADGPTCGPSARPAPSHRTPKSTAAANANADAGPATPSTVSFTPSSASVSAASVSAAAGYYYREGSARNGQGRGRAAEEDNYLRGFDLDPPTGSRTSGDREVSDRPSISPSDSDLNFAAAYNYGRTAARTLRHGESQGGHGQAYGRGYGGMASASSGTTGSGSGKHAAAGRPTRGGVDASGWDDEEPWY